MGNRRRLASIGGVVAALGALAWLCLSRGDEPKPLQIAVADVPIFLLEVCTTALLLAVATAIGPLLLAAALVVALTCATMGVLGLLPLGPSAAPAATMAAAGSGANALAAGLVVAAGALVAVAAYALVVLALLVLVRETARSDGGSRCLSLRRSAARWARSGSTSSSA